MQVRFQFADNSQYWDSVLQFNKVLKKKSLGGSRWKLAHTKLQVQIFHYLMYFCNSKGLM